MVKSITKGNISKVLIAILLFGLVAGVLWFRNAQEGPPASLKGTLYYDIQKVAEFADKCRSVPISTPKDQLKMLFPNKRQFSSIQDNSEHVKVLGPKVGDDDGSHVCDITLQEGKVVRTDSWVEIR